MTDTRIYYDKKHIQFLEKLWGDGYLSPGGKDEVRRILDDVDLSNKIVLDIGCGTGGITTSLVNDYNAKKVIGIDIEDDVCQAALARVKQCGFEHKIEILKVQPGAFPFENLTFDVVFSKDSIVHIQQKEFLSKEIFRVLKSGGYFLGSDWLRSHDGPVSNEMQNYLTLEDLNFDMASPQRYKTALKLAGFEKINLTNRNNWYLHQARKEIITLSKHLRDEFETISSKSYMDLTIETWQAMIIVLETGEHCPHHISALKPAFERN